MRTYWQFRTRSLPAISQESINIRYSPSLEVEVSRLIKLKSQYIQALDAYFNVSLPSPMVILLEHGELNRLVGGDYNLSSAGAYQGGVVFLGYDGNLAEETLVHELGHHYVYILTRGNYPVWYSEGVAQLMEYKLLGSVWFDGIKNNDYYMYSIEELSGDFYGLNDQISAYIQSFQLVKFIEELGGQANLRILQDLGRGVAFTSALEAHTGLVLDELYSKAFGQR